MTPPPQTSQLEWEVLTSSEHIISLCSCAPYIKEGRRSVRAHICVRMPTRPTRALMHTRIHMHARTYTLIRPCTYTCTHVPMHTHTHLCTRAYTHACTHTHMHTHTCTQVHTLARTAMHTCTHTPHHTHAHTCAHAHSAEGLESMAFGFVLGAVNTLSKSRRSQTKGVRSDACAREAVLAGRQGAPPSHS